MTTATPAVTRVGGQPAIARESEGFDMPALARRMIRPAGAMGGIAIAASIVAGAVQAASDGELTAAQIGAWNPGLGFLGIGLLLAAVTFALATILGELRDGGNAVQVGLRERALILKRPWTGYAFPPAMMVGLMTLAGGLAAGFVQAASLDTDPARAADIAAWAGPLRFAGVALVLTGVVLALATIVRALRFQADRVSGLLEERQG